MIIDRYLLNHIKERLARDSVVIILYGPRQAGKTTLLSQLVSASPGGLVYQNGDDIRTQETFSTPDLDKLKSIIGSSKLLVIDEAQQIPNIGQSLKLIFDNLHLPIIASGSASFDLANKTAEPLTGRATTYTLYPLSVLEIPTNLPNVSPLARLDEFLRFGLYPKSFTLTSESEKQEYLIDLVNDYLYKDILTFETIRKPKKVIDLLSLLALQIGQEVSIAELGQNLGLSKLIVEKYLDILEKMFVLINVRGFSRNLRKEISKTSKYYFVDLGLRNALIRNFNPLNLRSDTGVMFENFCIIERIKVLTNRRQTANFYFWRTYDQKEIDLIEEHEGHLWATEFKWSNKSASSKAMQEFSKNYPNSSFETVSPDNLLDFLKR